MKPHPLPSEVKLFRIDDVRAQTVAVNAVAKRLGIHAGVARLLLKKAVEQ